MRASVFMIVFILCNYFCVSQNDGAHQFIVEVNGGYSYLIGSKSRPFVTQAGNYSINRTPGRSDVCYNFIQTGMVVYMNDEKVTEDVHRPYYLSYGLGYSAFTYTVKREYMDYHFSDGYYSDNIVCVTKQNTFNVLSHQLSFYVIKHDISKNKFKMHYKFGFSVFSKGTSSAKPIDYISYGRNAYGYYSASNSYNNYIKGIDNYKGNAGILASIALPYTYQARKWLCLFAEPGASVGTWQINHVMPGIKGMGMFVDLKAGARFSF